MAITRLQQARQMFRYGGDTMGGPNDKSNDGLGDTGDFGSEKANTANTKSAETNLGMTDRDRAISNQYTNMPTPTVTLGVDKFDNPINVKTTYTAKRNRQKALDALNKQGISSFDPRVTKTFNTFDFSFAPQPQKKFGILDLVMIAASGGLLGPKIATGAKMFNTAKNVSKLAETIGLTEKDLMSSITSNFTENFGKNKTSKTDITDTKNKDDKKGGDGNGIASLDNQASNYDEYILLLQKLQSGTISDSERNRYNVLKNMLGI
jgi:hypothetical protein